MSSAREILPARTLTIRSIHACLFSYVFSLHRPRTAVVWRGERANGHTALAGRGVTFPASEVTLAFDTSRGAHSDTFDGGTAKEGSARAGREY